jgi:hypothetical protein
MISFVNAADIEQQVLRPTVYLPSGVAPSVSGDCDGDAARGKAGPRGASAIARDAAMASRDR